MNSTVPLATWKQDSAVSMTEEMRTVGKKNDKTNNNDNNRKMSVMETHLDRPDRTKITQTRTTQI